MSYTQDAHLEGESLSRSELIERLPGETVNLYVKIEAEMIGRKGKEWVTAHPGVIAQLALAAAVDFNQTMGRIRLQEISNDLRAIAAGVDCGVTGTEPGRK